jgi:hypothetical protein
VLKLAQRSLDLVVGRPEPRDGLRCTLMDAVAVVEVQPGDDVDGRCWEVDDAEDARVVGLGGDNAA